MRVTTLIDNSRLAGRDDLVPEHGLALHLQVLGRQVLLDSGASGAFADNAKALGIDLAQVELAVLSHHHYDHGGGLSRFLELNDRARIFLRRAEPAERYRTGLCRKSIGIDPALFDSGRLEPVAGPTVIAPGMHLLTEIDRSFPLPRGNHNLHVMGKGALAPDPFDHELVLVVREDDGLVVLSGCAHNGILNLVETARRSFPQMPVKAVVGGFHLVRGLLPGTMAESRRQVEAIGRRLLDLSVTHVCTGHCTCPRAVRVLESVLGDRLRHLPTGASIAL